jgi:hypothetical protein
MLIIQILKQRHLKGFCEGVQAPIRNYKGSSKD